MVFLSRNLAGNLDPLGIADARAAALVFALQRRIDTEVNECTELGIAEPQVLARFRVGGLFQIISEAVFETDISLRSSGFLARC